MTDPHGGPVLADGHDVGGWIAGRRVVTEWDRRVAEVWAAADNLSADELVAAIGELAAELSPGDPLAVYERASALDSTGSTAAAVPLYRQALDAGLPESRRRQAVIQLASSLRNLGQAAEAVRLLTAERSRRRDELDDAVAVFLALALADDGQAHVALLVTLNALVGHLDRYQRSAGKYVAEMERARPE